MFLCKSFVLFPIFALFPPPFTNPTLHPTPTPQRYFLVYQHCEDFKLVYLVELGAAVVASVYQTRVCIDCLVEAASETDEIIERESGQVYLQRIKELQMGGVKSWESSVGKKFNLDTDTDSESGVNDSYNFESTKQVAKVMIFGTTKEKNDVVSQRNTKRKARKRKARKSRSPTGTSRKGHIDRERSDKNNRKQAVGGTLINRDKSSLPGSARILGCLLEIRMLNKKARVNIRSFHRARAALFVAVLEELPVLVTNIIFLLSGTCEIEKQGSLVVFTLSLVASALLLGKRVGFIIANLGTTRLLHTQQLLDLYHDKVGLIDQDQDWLWYTYEQEKGETDRKVNPNSSNAKSSSGLSEASEARETKKETEVEKELKKRKKTRPTIQMRLETLRNENEASTELKKRKKTAVSIQMRLETFRKEQEAR